MTPVESGGSLLKEVFEACSVRLFPCRSSGVLFNPYRDEDPECDRSGAASIRRRNLGEYFATYNRRPDVVVVAEAPGPWGCRFSGVPITSEEQLVDPSFPLAGGVSSAGERPHSEYSARIFWRVMRDFFPRFIVWNALPLHPHRVGEPLSIRTPGLAELRMFSDLTRLLVECAGPRQVVALGRKAEVQLKELGVRCRYVRHPSQGGAVAFEEGMRQVFNGF